MNINIKKADEKDLYDIQKMCQTLVEYEYNKFNDKIFSLNWAMSENGKEHFQDLITNGLVYIAKLGKKV